MKMQFNKISHYLLTVLSVGSIGLWHQPARAEGSKELTANGGARPYLEWRNDPTGQFRRRNILKVYAKAGETINLGSSAIQDLPSTNNLGNILLFDDSANLSAHPLTPAPLLNCRTAQLGKGIIDTRAKEVAGPLPNAGGYDPCTFSVPTTGVYQVVFYGPDGATGGTGGSADPQSVGSASGSINAPNLDGQRSSVAMWDITVRQVDGVMATGRLYTDYIAMNMGASGRLLRSNLVIATQDGYRYSTDMNGLDPYGFIFFANSRGIIDSGGKPTYQSGVLASTVESPTHKIFFNAPNDDARTNLGYSLTPIQPPAPTNFTFTAGSGGSGNQTIVGAGGTFSFNHAVQGNYQLTIDLNRNGQTDANDVVIDGTLDSGNFTSVVWNGRDKNNVIVPAAPTNPYPARIFLKGGEYHFPMIDVENNGSGIKITMLSLPGAGTFSNGKNATTIYYNDTSLTGCTSSSCDGRAGVDSAGGAHAFSSNFGDTKTIDSWIYFPSDAVATNLIILDTVPRIRLVKRVTGIKKDGATTVTPIGGYIDDATDDDDNTALPWPGGASAILQGTINTLPAGIFLAPKDELEYTIYYLSDGTANAQNVRVCDFIPQHQTFVNGSIQLQSGNGPNNTIPDGSGTSGSGFYPTVVQPACNGGVNNNNGSVFLDVGNIPMITASPTSGYGKFSFRARVK
jgi:uncharacterized repeat protein (TIGR01451 family)